MYNTYIKGWQKYRVGDRYFFDYKIHGTVTGRYSSPLHPIPRDGKIRNLIKAPKGWTFVALDLATAEMRIAAHLSKDPEMRRCFVEGIDVHWRTMIENLSISQESEWTERVFATAEKLTGRAHSYSKCLEIMMEAGPKKCIKVEPKWYEGRTRAKAINFGYIFGKDKWIRMENERQAVNSPVQGLIGDFKAMLLIEIHQTFPRNKVRLVGEHHDAALAIVKNEHIDECVPQMLEMAKKPKLLETFKINLSVPMEGEAELGPWGKGEKYAA